MILRIASLPFIWAALFFWGGLAENRAYKAPDNILINWDAIGIALTLYLILGPIFFWAAERKAERLAAKRHQEVVKELAKASALLAQMEAAQEAKRLKVLEDDILSSPVIVPRAKGKGGRPQKYHTFDSSLLN